MEHVFTSETWTVSLVGWLCSVPQVNMTVGDCAYTKASLSLKNMVMIPTYAAELNSHMHYKCLDIRYAGWTFSVS